MPIINEVRGNLLDMFDDGQFNAIAHGCNCFHTMGAGIAGQIAKRYPGTLLADMQTPYGAISKLGDYSQVDYNGVKTVLNLYTQYHPGREDRVRLYNYISQAFMNLDWDYAAKKGTLIGIPQIGCGIAGGEWQEVVEIINKATPNLTIIAVEYAPG